MGMERRAPYADWAKVNDELARAGFAVEMRMIDGELAFPDEQPPQSWRELRVAHGGAMVTIRRGVGEVVLIAWGNADEAQRRLWEALAQAFTLAAE